MGKSASSECLAGGLGGFLCKEARGHMIHPTIVGVAASLLHCTLGHGPPSFCHSAACCLLPGVHFLFFCQLLGGITFGHSMTAALLCLPLSMCWWKWGSLSSCHSLVCLWGGIPGHCVTAALLCLPLGMCWWKWGASAPAILWYACGVASLDTV